MKNEGREGGGRKKLGEATGMSHNTVKEGAGKIDAGENKKGKSVENKKIILQIDKAESEDKVFLGNR
jgi:hypothetical protein